MGVKETELAAIRKRAESEGFVETTDPQIHADIHMERGDYRIVVQRMSLQDWYSLYYVCPCCNTKRIIIGGHAGMSDPHRMFEKLKKDEAERMQDHCIERDFNGKPFDFWDSPTLEEHAAMQGVKPMDEKTLDDIAKAYDGVDVDMDGFDEHIEELRHGNRCTGFDKDKCPGKVGK